MKPLSFETTKFIISAYCWGSHVASISGVKSYLPQPVSDSLMQVGWGCQTYGGGGNESAPLRVEFRNDEHAARPYASFIVHTRKHIYWFATSSGRVVHADVYALWRGRTFETRPPILYAATLVTKRCPSYVSCRMHELNVHSLFNMLWFFLFLISDFFLTSFGILLGFILLLRWAFQIFSWKRPLKKCTHVIWTAIRVFQLLVRSGGVASSF